MLQDQVSGQTIKRFQTNWSPEAGRITTKGVLRSLRPAPINIIVAVGQRSEIIDIEPKVGQTFQLGKANGSVLFRREGAWAGDRDFQSEPFRQADWTIALGLDRRVPLHTLGGVALGADGAESPLGRFPRSRFNPMSSPRDMSNIIAVEGPKGKGSQTTDSLSAQVVVCGFPASAAAGNSE